MSQIHQVAIIVSELRRQGWTIRNNGKHIMLYPADKTKKPFPIAKSPSDPYGHNNAIKQIRRAGGILPDSQKTL